MHDARTPRKLSHLQRLVDDARQLAAGGLHANTANPIVKPEELEPMIEAVQFLNRVAGLLERVPDFVVAHGAAYVTPAASGE